MVTERIGIVIGPKGRGTNMRAIIEACEFGKIPATVAVVVSPKKLTPAAEYAREHGIELTVVAPGEDYDQRMVAALTSCTLICLAGFTRLLPDQVLMDHPGRVLNIHPALLPKYGGRGMYGVHVHEAVIKNREPESGCTVHKVTEVYDEGEIIYQLKCPVLPDDTPETLAARVIQQEVLAYPEAILKVIRGDSS